MLFLYSLAPPRLLFSIYYSSLIRRVNIDGENLVTVYTTSYPRALDYDFQLECDSVYYLHAIISITTTLGKVMCSG